MTTLDVRLARPGGGRHRRQRLLSSRTASSTRPTPDCFLNGITRQTVIELARKRGIEVVERAIWPEELEGFEQFFLTGSAAEVTPVAEAGPWRFEVGEMTKMLRRTISTFATAGI
jgi:branched-subunit amino acid aminotransferase/4-amino-4-deoxychorismate lyase